MPQNLFKIYDGRNYFWQWDINQKLIVLNDTIDEVHFYNKDMEHAIVKEVCTDQDGRRVCNIPSSLLTIPKNIVASAYVTDDNANKTLRAVKFAVVKRPIPNDYVTDENFQYQDFVERLNILEGIIEDACLVQVFDTIEAAEAWANEHKEVGAVISVKIDNEWKPCVVEEDYSIIPICDCDEEARIREITELQQLVGKTPVSEQIENVIENLHLPETYDEKGAAAQVLKDAQKYTDDIAVQTLIDAKEYTNSKAADYDASGSADNALTEAKKYTDSKAKDYDTAGSASQALVDAKHYTDDRLKNYDLAGSAAAVQNKLTEEIARAKNEEAALTKEVQRLKATTSTMQSDLSAEITRSKAADETLTNEVQQLKNTTTTTNNNLIAEVNRAKAAEEALTKDVQQLKTKTDATQQELNNLESFVGVLPSDTKADTVVEYIDEKIQNINMPDIDPDSINLDAVLYTEQELTDEQRAQARANISKYDWRDITIANTNYTIADFSLFDSNHSVFAEYSFDIDTALTYMGVAVTSYPSLATIVHMVNLHLQNFLNNHTGLSSYLDKIFAEYDNLKEQSVAGNLICLCQKGTNENIKLGFYVGVTRASGYTYKMTKYLLTTYAHPPIQFKSSLEYIK